MRNDNLNVRFVLSDKPFDKRRKGRSGTAARWLRQPGGPELAKLRTARRVPPAPTGIPCVTSAASMPATAIRP
jgi:hypothetical protein